MKSNRVAQLRRLNNRLRSNSFEIYKGFLGKTLCMYNHIPEVRSLEAKLLSSDWTGLVDLADQLSSTISTTVTQQRVIGQVVALIRKYPFPPGVTNHDPRRKASESFLASEHRCKRINQRFRAYVSCRSPHEATLQKCRQWIEYVLGELRLADLGPECRYGPGASIGVNGSRTSLGRKLLAPRWTVSPGAFYLARAILRDDYHVQEILSWDYPHGPRGLSVEEFDFSFMKRVQLVDHNNITFVPKTATTERTIAVEPLLNGFVQLGVDSLMRKRLKRVGIDLTDQSRNQRLAREGSLPGSDQYVTIDLSSASDSISEEVVRYMLPPDWFDLLNSLRSRSYKLDGVQKRYHKFTTMGNGFCFPLETLLFASVCSAFTEDFSVYGDDIICRQSVCGKVLDTLRILGFKTNRKKSHIIGPFRESCGADWFEGEDVRPITLDFELDSVQNIIKFSNLMRSKSHLSDFYFGLGDDLLSLIPPKFLLVRPHKGRVDGALEVAHDVFMASPHARWSRKLQCWAWDEYVEEPVMDSSIATVTGYESALMKGALLGLKSQPGKQLGDNSPSPFTERRKTRTKIRREAYSGSSSTWGPAERR